MAKTNTKETVKPEDKKTDAKKAEVKKADNKKAAAKKAEDKNKKPGLITRLKEYLKNVKLEMKRVTWPSKKEVKEYSIIVVCTLIFFGVVIFLMDEGVVWLLEQFAKIG